MSQSAKCHDADPEGVALCGSAWSPSAEFRLALAKLTGYATGLAERDFAQCSTVDPFCLYGIALGRRWFGHVDEFQKLADQLLASGKLDQCAECKVIVLRDVGWSRITSLPVTRAAGVAQLLQACQILSTQPLLSRFYGHASPCRLALSLREVTEPDKAKMLVTQKAIESCDARWQLSCAARESPEPYLADIWW